MKTFKCYCGNDVECKCVIKDKLYKGKCEKCGYELTAKKYDTYKHTWAIFNTKKEVI